MSKRHNDTHYFVFQEDQQKMKLNEPGRQKLEKQISCRYAKYARPKRKNRS